jgi:hypothetical protein
MKKIYLPSLLLALLFSSCGNLKKNMESERKDTVLPPAAATAAMDAKTFAAFCADKPGMLEANGTICAVQTYQNTFTEKAASTQQSFDLPLTTVAAGAAVYAQGYADTNAAQIVLDGKKITDLPSSKPVTTDGGQLAYRFMPGTVYQLEVYVYTCLDQSQQTVRCPF